MIFCMLKRILSYSYGNSVTTVATTTVRNVELYLVYMQSLFGRWTLLYCETTVLRVLLCLGDSWLT